MAKTYKDPYREYTDATDVGADQLRLSTDQQAGISQAKLDWQKASEAGDQAGMDSAHQRAEAIRAQAGYSGGANGGAYNQFASESGAHMSGTHMSSPRWTPAYEKERADTLSQLQNRQPFSYDPEKDPTYQQYKAQYERGASKSMQDTMGQVMARTGGAGVLLCPDGGAAELQRRHGPAGGQGARASPAGLPDVHERGQSASLRPPDV